METLSLSLSPKKTTAHLTTIIRRGERCVDLIDSIIFSWSTRQEMHICIQKRKKNTTHGIEAHTYIHLIWRERVYCFVHKQAKWKINHACRMYVLWYALIFLLPLSTYIYIYIHARLYASLYWNMLLFLIYNTPAHPCIYVRLCVLYIVVVIYCQMIHWQTKCF